jgi:protein SCO1
MKKTALYGLLMAALLPLCSYLVVDYFSKRSVQMPRRYYLDTVVAKTEDGKTSYDTLWHQLAPMPFTNQLGDAVSWDRIGNKIVVANCFFTRCPNICPALTRQMKKLQLSFEFTKNKKQKFSDTSIIHFLSFSVDPERDTTAALKAYADRFFVRHDNWWMMTGDKKQIYDYMMNELKVPAEDGGAVDSAFIHTPNFVLIDKYRVVRGYYNGLDSVEMQRLAEDVGKLLLEKDKKIKSPLFQKIKSLAPLWILIVVLVVVFLFFFNSNKKHQERLRG